MRHDVDGKTCRLCALPPTPHAGARAHAAGPRPSGGGVGVAPQALAAAAAAGRAAGGGPQAWAAALPEPRMRACAPPGASARLGTAAALLLRTCSAAAVQRLPLCFGSAASDSLPSPLLLSTRTRSERHTSARPPARHSGDRLPRATRQQIQEHSQDAAGDGPQATQDAASRRTLPPPPCPRAHSAQLMTHPRPSHRAEHHYALHAHRKGSLAPEANSCASHHTVHTGAASTGSEVLEDVGPNNIETWARVPHPHQQDGASLTCRDATLAHASAHTARQSACTATQSPGAANPSPPPRPPCPCTWPRAC